MKPLLAIVLLVVVVIVGLKLAGVPVPYLDYEPGIAGPDVNLPEIEVRPPGFDGFGAP